MKKTRSLLCSLTATAIIGLTACSQNSQNNEDAAPTSQQEKEAREALMEAASTYTSDDGIDFIINDDHGTLTAKLGPSSRVFAKELKTPQTLVLDNKEYKVIALGKNAFAKTKLRKIELSEGIETVSRKALSCCGKLKQIILPASLKDIDDQAFYACDELESIEVNPNNKWYASLDGILYTKNLKEIILYPSLHSEADTIMDGVTTIGAHAFGGEDYYSNNIHSLVLPASMTILGDKAFANCIYLNNIEMQNGILVIANQCFANCTSLTNINIPASVNELGTGVFGGCKRLTSINIHPDNKNFKSIDGVVYSKDGETLVIFPNGKDLASFKFPSSVKKIAPYAFYNLNQYIDLVLPQGITTIGDYAFAVEKGGLSSITLPKSVKKVSDTAFNGQCPSFKTIRN